MVDPVFNLMDGTVAKKPRLANLIHLKVDRHMQTWTH